MKRTAVGIGVLVALAVLLTAGMGGVAAGAQPTNETAERGNASFGASVSSFMQASSAEAEGEVDDGMFEASLNRAETKEERRELIEQRQAQLEQRQQRLANRRAAISEEDSEVRNRAIAAHVTTGASGLEQSANETASVAAEAGVDTTRLDALRNEARNLSGGEVAELARGLAGPMFDGERGPPGDTGNADGDSNTSVDVPGASNGGGPPVDTDSDDSISDAGGDGPPGSSGSSAPGDSEENGDGGADADATPEGSETSRSDG
ncbi:hypothetical protein [Natronomonas gomsonensis]|uniref:hypothetical protein n=1 Tax=Natronomonas gomsonensis TaxID=1046043 RepID=UPI0015BEA8F1|nr:hypothetical protein [Natronomonas gomsonensis]